MPTGKTCVLKKSSTTDSRGKRLAALFVLGCLVVATGWAQEETGTADAHPFAQAAVNFEGRRITSVSFSLTPRGPLFGLSAMATVLGVELTVGPLGDSHRLVLKDKEILVGPESAVTVVAKADGSRQEIVSFSQPPIKGATDLKVPLDFLELAFSEELGFDFAWDEATSALEIRRREVRTLRVSVNVIHQNSSTVEIRFSTVPRYRVERFDDALEIRLVADRLALPVDTSRTSSPLVRGVTAATDRLRIELAEGTGVAEPRLLESPEVRLIVEVFRQAAPRALAPQSGGAPGVRTVVLDPGHGGVETGAVGPAGTTEKDLALTVSRSLKRLLERRLPVKVVLTRAGDADLPLETRTAIANQNKADLFISLHFNSYFGRRAHGAETYFLSREASDQVAAAAAAEENRAGGEPSPESDLQLILWDMAQSYHLAESQRFANLVQEELNLTLGLRDRGVKQAPFRVLMGATMPAVLVELGFLSNPEEESKLKSPIYQADLVDSLFRAVRRFKTQMEAQEEPPPEGDTASQPGPRPSPDRSEGPGRDGRP